MERYDKAYFHPGGTGRERADWDGLNTLQLIAAAFRGRRRLLDLGCGTGSIAPRLAGVVEEYVGLEGSRYALREAERLHASPQAEFLLHDLESEELPFEDDTFDGILACHVLEHLDPAHLPSVLAEVNRALVAEGRFFAIVPNCGPSYRKHLLRKGDMGRDDSTHRSFFTLESLRALASNYVLVLDAFTYPMPGLWRLSFGLARALAGPYGDNVHLVATKKDRGRVGG